MNAPRGGVLDPSYAIKPPLPVEDPNRFYQSGVRSIKFIHRNISTSRGTLTKNVFSGFPLKACGNDGVGATGLVMPECSYRASRKVPPVIEN